MEAKNTQGWTDEDEARRCLGDGTNDPVAMDKATAAFVRSRLDAHYALLAVVETFRDGMERGHSPEEWSSLLEMARSALRLATGAK